MEDYFTVEARAVDEFIEKRSRFIGYAAPAKTEEEALAFIGEIRAKHREATHNVYAYILRERNLCRYSDDGEPQGTAGMPVLSVLRKENVTDLCVVATRYFGGVLLGGGGLVRAYSHTAKIALDAAHIIEMCVCDVVTLSLDYGLYGRMDNLLSNYIHGEVKTDFGADVTMKIVLKKCETERFIAEMTDISAGRCIPKAEKSMFCPI